MMKMKQHILPLVAGLISLGAAAQNFNPTVEVTNIYEGSLQGIEKPAFVMAVPDSVTRFDLTFDYSVSDNPYRGAYDFEPYMVNMRPQTGPKEKKRFFLRAGAGWTIHPELDAVFSPKTGKGLDFNLYARHRSYFGDYRNIAIGNAGALLPDGSSWRGYRSSTRIGADGSYGWEKGLLTFDLGFRNLMTRDRTSAQQLNGGDASLSVRSTDPAQPIYYEAALKAAADVISAPGKSGSDMRIDANGAFGARIGKSNLALLGFNVQYDVNSLIQTSTGSFAVIPQYRWTGNGSVVRIGARISMLLRPGDSAYYRNKGQLIYPDVYLSHELIEGKVVAFASATGGERINSFSILGARNSFYPTNFGVVENTVERFNLAAGIRANVLSRLQLSIKGGYALYASQVWDSVVLTGSPELYAALAAYSYRGGSLAYAEADAAWVSDRVRADAHLKVRKAWLLPLLEESHEIDMENSVLGPPLLEGGARISYSWKDRIRGGASVAFATERPGTCTLPGWVDLGVFAEMAVSRRFTLWIKGENLLNQSIQRIPLIAEKGPAITAGIQISL